MLTTVKFEGMAETSLEAPGRHIESPSIDEVIEHLGENPIVVQYRSGTHEASLMAVFVHGAGTAFWYSSATDVSTNSFDSAGELHVALRSGWQLEPVRFFDGGDVAVLPAMCFLDDGELERIFETFLTTGLRCEPMRWVREAELHEALDTEGFDFDP